MRFRIIGASSGVRTNEAVPQGKSKTVKTWLLRGCDEAEVARCCPIGFEETGKIPTPPQRATHEGKEPGETVTPTMDESQESQEHIDQQGRPDLPAHRIGAVSQEIGELEGLLDLLEEDFDRPAAAVKVGDAGGAPFHVIGQENHLHFGAVDFHQGCDAAHDVGIIGEGAGIAQGNDFIAQDATGHRQGLEDFAGHVVLRAADPEDATLQEIEEVGEVHIRLVKDHDLPRANGGAEFAGAFGVVFPCGVDDGEAGQEAVEIEPQMALGGRLATAVFGPVHAGGHQGDGGRIDHMDDAAEATGDSFAAIAAGKSGLEALQMLKHHPEDLFRQTRVPFLVGMGEVVTAGRRRGPQRHQKPAVQAQGVAHIVKADGVGQVRIDQADQMALGRKRPRLFVYTGLARQPRHQIRRNQIANLPQHSKLAAAWCGCFIHPCRVAGQSSHAKPFSLPAMGWLWLNSRFCATSSMD